jgi:dTDP-4-amino-4,6-dideoxygalactose transaminase
MSRTPFVDLAAQRQALAPALAEACLASLDRGDYILGRDVLEFEREWADWTGVRHAIGVDSGTSALELALRAHGIGEGDEVITVANTFVATAFAIYHAGARAVLVDADPVTYLMDPDLIEAAITPRTRAIMPVHLYGQPADMDAINAIARRHGLTVIEDACQAHGARAGSVRVGALGDAAAFSFYPGKNLGAQGDGGMLVTDDDEVAERARLLRNYGQRVKYTSEIVGYNRRLDTLQAAMLRVKLPHLDGWNAARREHAARYDEALADLPLVRPVTREAVEHVWHLYVVRVPGRDAVRERLAAEGIETGIHYPVPVHLQPACADLDYLPGSFPVTEAAAAEIVSLPMYPELPEDAPRRVADVLAACLDAVPRPVGALAG